MRIYNYGIHDKACDICNTTVDDIDNFEWVKIPKYEISEKIITDDRQDTINNCRIDHDMTSIKLCPRCYERYIIAIAENFAFMEYNLNHSENGIVNCSQWLTDEIEHNY